MVVFIQRRNGRMHETCLEKPEGSSTVYGERKRKKLKEKLGRILCGKTRIFGAFKSNKTPKENALRLRPR